MKKEALLAVANDSPMLPQLVSADPSAGRSIRRFGTPEAEIREAIPRRCTLGFAEEVDEISASSKESSECLEGSASSKEASVPPEFQALPLSVDPQSSRWRRPVLRSIRTAEINKHDQGRLARTQLFHNRSKQFFDCLKDDMVFEHFKEGTKMMKEGELGSKLYVLIRGEVDLVRQGKAFARLTSGAIIGELACLDIGARKGERSATVLCVTSCDVRTLDKSLFLSTLQDFPAERVHFMTQGYKKLDDMSWNGEGELITRWSPGRLRMRDCNAKSKRDKLESIKRERDSKYILNKNNPAYHHLIETCKRAAPSSVAGMLTYQFDMSHESFDSSVRHFGVSSGCPLMHEEEPEAATTLQGKKSIEKNMEKRRGSMALVNMENKCKGHSLHLRNHVYAGHCSESGLKSNSGIMGFLARCGCPPSPCFCSLSEVSFRDFYVGDRGIVAVLPLLRYARGLKLLSLAGNAIHRKGLEHILVSCKNYLRQGVLTALDLSHNPLTTSLDDLYALLDVVPSLVMLGTGGKVNLPMDKQSLLRWRCLAKFADKGLQGPTREFTEMKQALNLTLDDGRFADRSLVLQLIKMFRGKIDKMRAAHVERCLYGIAGDTDQMLLYGQEDFDALLDAYVFKGEQSVMSIRGMTSVEDFDDAYEDFDDAYDEEGSSSGDDYSLSQEIRSRSENARMRSEYARTRRGASVWVKGTSGFSTAR